VHTADKKVATDRFLRNIELSGDLNGAQRTNLLDHRRAVSCQPHAAAPLANRHGAFAELHLSLS
jgi:hypothetical protein